MKSQLFSMDRVTMQTVMSVQLYVAVSFVVSQCLNDIISYFTTKMGDKDRKRIVPLRNNFGKILKIFRQ